MPFWRLSDRMTLACLDEGAAFRLCRNGLRYQLIDKSFSKARAEVKPIGQHVTRLPPNHQVISTLNKNCLVVLLNDKGE